MTFEQLAELHRRIVQKSTSNADSIGQRYVQMFNNYSLNLNNLDANTLKRVEMADLVDAIVQTHNISDRVQNLIDLEMGMRSMQRLSQRFTTAYEMCLFER